MQISKINFIQRSANVWIAPTEVGNFVIEMNDLGQCALIRDKIKIDDNEVNSSIETIEVGLYADINTARKEAQKELLRVLEKLIRF